MAALNPSHLNPIRVCRKRNGQTLEHFADSCRVHWQAVFLNEQGVYPNILPKIMGHMLSLGSSRLEVTEDYRLYQRTKRETNGVRFSFGATTLPEPSWDQPVAAFRKTLPLSRMAFCKLFCIHPAELSKLEAGEKYTFSEQFKQAMLEAGLPGTVLDELEFRCGEFAKGEWVSG